MCNPKTFTPRDTTTIAALGVRVGLEIAAHRLRSRIDPAIVRWPLEDQAAKVDEIAAAIDLVAPPSDPDTWETRWSWSESIGAIAYALVHGEPMDPSAIESRLVRR